MSTLKWGGDPQPKRLAPTSPVASEVLSAVQLPRWVTRVIQVPDGKGMTSVAAEILGSLALFHEPEKGGKMVLVHPASGGNRLARMALAQNLKRVAELLMRELPELLNLTSRAEINARRPRWVREWLRACEAADRWLDPQAFKDGKLHEEPTPTEEQSHEDEEGNQAAPERPEEVQEDSDPH